ncbi:hypothetical protein PR202_gb05207 [Eleusine coracana subsp. coracana]|uniref:RING-type E3 ubiquitin transferase n=1 Tax=Eleusine coracana subsp. coracana TaxID=191504 RepID=A0AAV5E6G5_ELECO|nr:hypothetical protein QOZ80_1BG0078700 [Eleusine coracana subsp. coracana]GJN18086.1 hypothetical protein PR202_gb05207 [Eleusine coracana subsp. coracana]
MARRRGHLVCLPLLLLLLLLPAATTAASSYSSLCPTPAPAAGNRSRTTPIDLPVITTFTGHFSGGEDLHFAPDQPYIPRSFTFFTRRSAHTTNDPTVLHVVATLTLAGTGTDDHRDNAHPHSVSFDLEGYSSSTAELCMVGSGSYAREDGLGVVRLSDVVLRLHVPRPANLSHPFVTGRLEGAEFGNVTLVAYTDGYYAYDYGSGAPCPAPPAPVRQLDYIGRSSSRLKALLRGSFSLEHSPGGSTSSPLRLPHQRMLFDQIHCDGNGKLRAYIAFDTMEARMSKSNYTVRLRDGLVVGDEALVAEGSWNTVQNQLCLKAWRVARSGPSRADLAVRDCHVGISLWFPTVWSIRDRSVAAGKIWNTSTASSDTGNKTSSDSDMISVSRSATYRDDLSSYVVYNYTRVEEAKKQYLSRPALRKERKGSRFPGNYSYRDFAFRFYLKEKRGSSASVYGYASPVTIGAALVQGDRLMADDAFYSNWTSENQRLRNISYDLRYYVVGHLVSSENFSPQWLSRQRRISTEGVYDTETGSLCMVACQGITNSSSSDCEVLVTAQFAPVDDAEEARDRIVGTISSLRNKTAGDTLFFKPVVFAADGMYAAQIAESVSRMDVERVMLVASMTLSCVFIGLQLRHVGKHPEALPAMSVTMLVVLAVGNAVPLVLNLEAIFADAKDSPNNNNKRFVRLTSVGMLELNEVVMRVSSMLAFVLQLRLLQLALASRHRPVQEAGGNKQEDDSSLSSDAERSTLWICLPLYALGAVLVWIVHMNAPEKHSSWYRPRAIADDLAGYTGLVLDGFLLPQVVWNAFLGLRVQALSPWFYGGVSLVRAAPHVYDVFRRRSCVPSLTPSYVYAGPRDDLFGVTWDVAVPCGAALLAVLVFLQQRLGGAFLCGVKGRRPGGYEKVSTISS